MKPRLTKPDGTVFDHNVKADALGATGMRGLVYRAVNKEVRNQRHRALATEAYTRRDNPSPAEAWFWANWEPLPGERFYFVTDSWVSFVRNLGSPYIIELDDTREKPEDFEAYRRHMIVRRSNIPFYLIKPFDLKSLLRLHAELSIKCA